MDGLNPIFQDIIDDFMKSYPTENTPAQDAAKSKPACVKSTDDFFSDIVSDTMSADAFDMAGQLEEIKTAIEKHPDEVVAIIKSCISELEEMCIESNICPECGADLEWVRDKRYDNYVPYGGTSVLESEGGAMKCPNCGYEVE